MIGVTSTEFGLVSQVCEQLTTHLQHLVVVGVIRDLVLACHRQHTHDVLALAVGNWNHKHKFSP